MKPILNFLVLGTQVLISVRKGFRLTMKTEMKILLIIWSQCVKGSYSFLAQSSLGKTCHGYDTGWKKSNQFSTSSAKGVEW